MKHTILIPTFNKCDELLKPCLQSIFRHTTMTDVELIIVANGCTDNTHDYVTELIQRFKSIGMGRHIKLVWNDAPLGYAGAVNAGLAQATGEYITLLNNDVILLEQEKNTWLDMLQAQFNEDQNCGISCVLKGHCIEIKSEFAVFFCAMIRRDVFYNVGLLDESFGVGGCEDIDFSYRAKMMGYTIREAAEVRPAAMVGFTGNVPIYHIGEATVNDQNLVKDFAGTFQKNLLKLTAKHNREYYKFLLSNNYERAVFLKGDEVFPREKFRYQWANDILVGRSVLDVGCSTGYGSQFLTYCEYTGIDYDPLIIDIAKQQEWGRNKKFFQDDVRSLTTVSKVDTIIAFEIIEHMDNGLEVIKFLKKHCSRLIISVPFNETPGFWGEHHKLHGLNESHFPGFKFAFMDEDGVITEYPSKQSRFNLMLGVWDE